MIKNLMKNIIKWKNIIIAVIIFLIIAITLINSIRYEKASSVSNKSFDVFSKISMAGAKIKNKFIGQSKESEIEELKQENAKLRNELIKNTMQKNDITQLTELKKALKFVTDENANSFVSADIVAKNSGNYYKTFTISAGTNSGVKQDSIVVNGEGLVGRVYQVSQNYSKAISIIDNRSPISFEIMGRNEDTGMLSQDIRMAEIEDESLIKGYMFDANSPVKIGEIVTTSGLGLYPAGIPIGKVEQIIPDNQNILKYVIVRPFVDLTHIDKVMIFNKKEI